MILGLAIGMYWWADFLCLMNLFGVGLPETCCFKGFVFELVLILIAFLYSQRLLLLMLKPSTSRVINSISFHNLGWLMVILRNPWFPKCIFLGCLQSEDVVVVCDIICRIFLDISFNLERLSCASYVISCPHPILFVISVHWKLKSSVDMRVLLI